jgi:hypothetical protein
MWTSRDAARITAGKPHAPHFLKNKIGIPGRGTADRTDGPLPVREKEEGKR